MAIHHKTHVEHFLLLLHLLSSSFCLTAPYSFTNCSSALQKQLGNLTCLPFLSFLSPFVHLFLSRHSEVHGSVCVLLLLQHLIALHAVCQEHLLRGVQHPDQCSAHPQLQFCFSQFQFPDTNHGLKRYVESYRINNQSFQLNTIPSRSKQRNSTLAQFQFRM